MFKILIAIVVTWLAVLALALHYKEVPSTRVLKIVAFGGATLCVASLILMIFVGVF